MRRDGRALVYSLLEREGVGQGATARDFRYTSRRAHRRAIGMLRLNKVRRRAQLLEAGDRRKREFKAEERKAWELWWVL